ncbi:MAG: S-adenosyl-L-methionine-dependent methyltransferase [Linnemannia gamsii]|nr:MAG: S-adenosyl-L-methionine-dependent methyltransferase [Linnemannia gamsii]
MATFSSKSFNSALYQSFRPGYNNNFFKMVYNYHAKHNGQFDTAVDVGTGTGQVAVALAEKFKQVHGIDASATMLSNAIQKPNITYHVAKGEDLAVLPTSSVDVLTVAQAMHWFHHPTFFSEVKRVLKPRGTFAAVGYSFVIFEDHPRATKRIYDLGDQPDQLGTMWDNGRLILDNLYKSIDVPLQNVERHYFPDSIKSQMRAIDAAVIGEESLPPVMTSRVTMKHFRNYIKTWSSYKNYCEKYPSRPNIVDVTIDTILKEENLKDEDEVNITWPTVVILGENDA